MPLCEQPILETGARLLLLHHGDPELEDKNSDNHADLPPAPGQHPNHQQQGDPHPTTASCPSEVTSGIYQGLDAIEQLDANGAGGDGVDEPVLIANSGGIGIGSAVHHGHADAHPSYIHQQQPFRHHHLAVLNDKGSVEMESSSPAPLNLSPQPGDEDTTVARPAASAAGEHEAAPCCQSTSLSSMPPLALPSPFKVLPDGDDAAVAGDEPYMSSSSSTMLMSLTAVTASSSSSHPQSKPASPRTDSHHLWRASSPSISSSPMFNGDLLASTATFTARSHQRGNPDGILASEDRSTFLATNWRQEHQQQGSGSTMEQTWTPTSTITSGIPPLLSDWDVMPSSPSRYGDRPGNKTSFPTTSYNGAPVSLASYAAINTTAAGSPSFGATWPSDSDSGYNQPSLYPSSPIRLDDPASLAEYARYPSHNGVPSLHDTMPQLSSSSSSGGFHSYSHSGYYSGPEFRSASYPSTMDMYQSSRSGATVHNPFSPSKSGPGPSFSYGFPAPILSPYDRMSSSSVLMGGSDTFTPPTVSSNSLYNPTSMSAFLPPFNMSSNNGGPSTVLYNSSKNALPRDPLSHSPFQEYAPATGAMGRTMTKQEMQVMDPDPKFCHNCKTTVTPSWRRCPQGRILLCNACGLYQKLHGKSRPFFKAKDGTIKIHRTLPEHEPCALCKTTQTPVWRKGPDNSSICNGCSLIARHGKSLILLPPSNDVSSSSDAAASSSSARIFSSSTLAATSVSSYCSNSSHTVSTGKRARARSVISLARSESPFDQHHDSPSSSLSPPHSDLLYNSKSKSSSSSSRRSSHQRRNRRSTGQGSTTTGASLPSSIHATALSRMSTKTRPAKKRKTSSSSSRRVHYENAATDEASISTPMSMMDQYTSGDRSYSFSICGSQGFDAGGKNEYDMPGEAGGHGGGSDGGREIDYDMSDWRQHPQHGTPSPLSFYPDETEPFLPSPEGSHGGHNEGTGGTLGHHQRHQQQYQSQETSRSKLTPHLSRSHPSQSHHGHQCQQQQHQQYQFIRQHQYDRQPEGQRFHPTPPSDFSYSPSATSGFQSEAIIGPVPIAVSVTTAGPGATITTQVPLRLSTSSAIPGALSKPMKPLPSPYQDGPASTIVNNKQEGAEKAEEEGGNEDEEATDDVRKGASMTNTGSDLSSAGEYDSDE
ncbi:hypothetical protein BG015_005703 [Linnemannia schmuckeri]|uniref:GATA-type domain-containing protein n=1 Tax=Linnemannia schmuckeri TaxID=64567 RepID=A0A9P5S365_9FUNG|nr:hypothetical protein BG015_005703 [Linnemannia schmuckeri]